MLRAIVVALLLANLAFWVWSAGLLQGLGLGPTAERDPNRLAQQVRSDAVRVLPAAAAAAALRAASAAPMPAPAAVAALECLEAGPFAPDAIAAAEQALAAIGLPEGRWRRTQREAAAQWAVVLGPFNSREGLQAKREEIGRLKLALEAVDMPGKAGGDPPQPALVLGRYDSRAAAEAGLAGFNKRGVRTARVAAMRAVAGDSRLRVENATPDLAAQLRALSSAALGAGFGVCLLAAPDLAAPSAGVTPAASAAR